MQNEIKRNLFDMEKLMDLIMSYDYSQSLESAQDGRNEIADFINSEIRRNLAGQSEIIKLTDKWLNTYARHSPPGIVCTMECNCGLHEVLAKIKNYKELKEKK